MATRTVHFTLHDKDRRAATYRGPSPPCNTGGMEGLHFIGLAYSTTGTSPSAEDVVRLAALAVEQGFTVCDGWPSPPEDPTNRISPEQAPATESGREGTIHAWRGGFEAWVSLEHDWTVQVLTPLVPADLDRGWIERIVPLIGASTTVSGAYIGFRTDDPATDFSFTSEDPPFEITDPLTLAYFGRRYLDDNGSLPDFAENAEVDIELANGRLVVPRLADLA